MSATEPPSSPPLVKVALVGDSGVGKTSLMVRYVEGTFDETQLPTQGVNFMEQTVSVQGHELTFSVWDIGGSHFESMLPLVCNDAAVVLLMFDLCRRESIDSIRKWHEKARSFNKHAVPILVGCKWDQLMLLPEEEQRHVEDMARRFAKAVTSSRLTRRPPSAAAALHGHPCHSHWPGRFPSSWAVAPAPSKPPASPSVAAPRLRICALTDTGTADLLCTLGTYQRHQRVQGEAASPRTAPPLHRHAPSPAPPPPARRWP
jgi:Gtp-binding protein of the ras superfamily involved in termination of M-phase